VWGWGPGTPLTGDILSVDEDGNRLHRFNREESKFYMLGVSFEEFVAAHR